MGEIATLPNAQPLAELSADIIETLVVNGDIGPLKPHQRVAYYLHRCRVLGIDPGEQPFEVINLSGKIRLYCTKAGANALTRVNRLSVEIRSTTIDGSLVTVVARATAPDGRFADDIGVLDLDDESKKGTRLSKPNAIMKCATKAKRRAVLALVGLGVLDESEVEDIRGAKRVRLDAATGEIQAEQAPVNAIDVEASEPSVGLGPRCSGKAAGIAEGNRKRTVTLAEHHGMSFDDAWPGVLKRAQIDLSKYASHSIAIPTPEQLEIDDEQIVRRWLDSKLVSLSANAEAGHTAERAGESVVESAQSRVLTTWQSLVEGAHVDPESREDAFASWANVPRWPTNPDGQLWAACLDGLERWRSERGVKL